jgi:hypothetical protein
MSNFCTKCGASSGGGAFCVQCGTDLRSQPSAAQPPAISPNPVTPSSVAPSPIAPTPVASAPVAVAPVAVAPVAPTAKPRGLSAAAKIGIAAVVVIVLFGAAAVAGVFYVAHRVTQKVHEVKGELLGNSDSSGPGSNSGGSNSSASHSSASIGATPSALSSSNANNSASSSSGNSVGDVCRYLSKQDVGQAIGVEIVATKSEDGGCSYLAVGDSADMTAKHMAALSASKGADAQGQNMIQNFAGAIFKSSQEQEKQTGSDENGNVPVFVVSVDDNGAEEQMRLNHDILGRFPGSQDLPGIGDEAFDAGNAIMTIRKGNKLIRIMYTTCPCTIEAVKPLAKRLADAV